FLTTARTAGHGPATFLFDEILELRIFESFPGLRHAVDEILRVMAASGNRFVLTSRYVARASRLLRAAGPPFVRLDTVPLTLPEIRSLFGAEGSGACPPAGTWPDKAGLDEFARVVDVLSGGHPASARAISEAMIAMRASGGVEPVSALAATLAPGGRLAERCLRSYEIRLHRARGYGALKAILDILAGEETLTLTEISHRLRRTPGSTKDYLSWLEDVDLVIARQKRYRFSDPMLRLWVRLYCRPVPPTDDIVAREVRQFALERLSTPPADAPAVPGRSRCATEPVDTP
ncbi:MAG: helix-turn-helix transcriptional regulator, partial [Acidobacteria bacterium]|nr:helix-turn-helix transcriptional regulator [Acidobacteriota bacterium]